jgi:AraC family transcriptional regulator, regulatory protein of adaptative response / DNA-3-methyladenine glycosylase II
VRQSGGVVEDFEQCYRAVQSRDPRFDGWFFTAVTSTGIYCRPSCPARTPMRSHVRFYPSAAAAQAAGFRACKRCRPNATPGSPEWNTRADVTARAMRLIADGVVDREGVPALARQVGYSVRQLQRTLLAEVGAGPIAIARAQRAQTARVLIETTTLSMADIAFAAGFASIRQFNDTVRSVFATTPTHLRSRVARTARSSPGASSPLVLRLPFRQPLCPDNLFGHLAATSIAGVEEVRGSTYRRTLRLPHGPAIVELSPTPAHIGCRVMLSDLRDLTTAISRCRWLLDLDADPEAVDEQLAVDPVLRPRVRKSPGRRVPRGVDGDEIAVRIVLGQQISTAAARTHAARLVARHGDPLLEPDGGLTHLFPTAESLEKVGSALPADRRRTVSALARALAGGQLTLGPGTDRHEAMTALDELPGIGAWSSQMIAMRALGDPDAFPVSDLGVRRGAEALGLPGSPAALSKHSDPWRPWRAYAVQYLWAATDHRINLWPPPTTTRGDEPSPEDPRRLGRPPNDDKERRR